MASKPQLKIAVSTALYITALPSISTVICWLFIWNRLRIVSHEGEWLYYHSSNDGGNLCKIKTDGSGKEILVNATVMFTCVVDGYMTGQHIVTLDLETLEKLNHIEADTEPLCSGPNGWVYYFKHSEGQAWYAMSPDGKEHKID